MYTPVAQITSIMILLALSSIYNLHIHQIDVKTTLLTRDFDEAIYME